ncbi:uncharacterized protein LOC113040222 [Carassius auratus]|uniref:Uncharacterized protein LOC113040222 n=1 Tax=Carassius auratus TaxID=7957 RepID=A0A6P6J2H8_CARAU|nr:uncharacterized protein LOC113040222 [Carassius auratus]
MRNCCPWTRLKAASALHTMDILQVFQTKILRSLDESSPHEPGFRNLRSATDFALGDTKATAQAIRRSMANLVVLEHHLWHNLTEIKESDKVAFLDAPVSPFSLFGPAIEGFTEHYTAAQKLSQAMQHLLPKHSSSEPSRPRTVPTKHQSKPVPSTSQVVPPKEQHPAHPANRPKPPRRQGPRQRIVLDPMPSKSDRWGKRRRGKVLPPPDDPQKLFRLPAMRPGPTVVASTQSAIIMANAINISHFQKESGFPLPHSSVFKPLVTGLASDII